MIRNDILRKEGIVYVGQWEPIYFQKQTGNNFENLQSTYDFQRSEPYVKALAKMGVNQIWNNFHKGYGMLFEDSEQKRNIEFVKICHKHGVRVISYFTFGTLAPDFLKEEIPDCDSWVVRTDLGQQRASYVYQSFRGRVDFTSQEWQDYMIKVIDKALNMGVDGIHFDNAEWAIGEEQCRCERCVKLFREWMNKKYGNGTAASKKAGQLKYGTNNVNGAMPPWFTPRLHIVQQREIRIAIQQDWIQFRCDVFAKAAKRFSDHIKKRGRIVEFNFGKNDNENNPYYRGLDYERLYPLADITFHESMDEIRYNKYGSPICAIRNYKIAQSFDIPVMNYCETPLSQAESFAFNQGVVGRWGYGKDRGIGKDNDRQKFIDFFNKNKKYSIEGDSIANVAVLRHRMSMTNDTYPPYMDASAVEQTLQENQIPFNIIAGSHLNKLGRYKVLIIASMRYLSDAEADKISAWVKKGGQLLLIGEVGTIDEYNQQRTWVKTVKTMEDLMYSREIKPVFADMTKEDFKSAFKVAVGNGRVAFIPALEHVEKVANSPANWTVEADQINIPKNGAVLLGEIVDLLGDDRLMTVSGARDLAVDFCKRADTKEGVIHILNLAYMNNISRDATVSFRWSKPVKNVTVLKYDEEKTTLPVTKKKEKYTFDVKGVREHAVIVFK